MTIPIITVLIHILVFIFAYICLWKFYRYVLHPNYRWHQRGNICYDHAHYFSLFFATIIYIFLLLLYFDLINFTLS